MGVWEGDRRRGIRVVKMEIEVAGGGAGLIMACTSAREGARNRGNSIAC